MRETYTHTYWIDTDALFRLKQQLDRIARKADKLGVGTVDYVVGSPTARDIEFLDDSGTRRSVKRIMYPVTLTGSVPQLEGWEFIATLQHLYDDQNNVVNVLRVVPGVEIPEHYRHADATNCDHCCTRRKRNDTYVVRDTQTGVYKQVGRNCLKDFIRGADPHTIASKLEAIFSAMAVLADTEEGSRGGGGQGTSNAFSMIEFLSMTAAIIREFGWLSRGRANETGAQATADTVLARLGANPRATVKYILPNEADIKLAEQAREYISENLSRPDVSDYEHNLYVSLAVNYVTSRTAGIVASAIPFYQREMSKIAERSRPQTISEWVGVEGERQDFYVTPTAMFTTEGFYGTTFIWKFVTREGNVLTWFTSSGQDLEIDTKEYRITGTVKKHDEYKGVKQTILTRVTVYTDEGRLAAEEKERKKAARDAAKAEKAVKAAEKAAAKAAKAGQTPVAGMLADAAPYMGHYASPAGCAAFALALYQEFDGLALVAACELLRDGSKRIVHVACMAPTGEIVDAHGIEDQQAALQRESDFDALDEDDENDEMGEVDEVAFTRMTPRQVIRHTGVTKDEVEAARPLARAMFSS